MAMIATDPVSRIAKASTLIVLGGELKNEPDGNIKVVLGAAEVKLSAMSAALLISSSNKVKSLVGIPTATDPAAAIEVLTMVEAELVKSMGGSDKSRILFVPADGAGGFYRVRFPGTLLAESGAAAVSFAPYLRLSDVFSHDIIWLQMQSSIPDLETIKLARKNKIKTVLEVDDAFWCIPENFPGGSYMSRERIDLMWEMARTVHMVVTTTEHLAKAFRGVGVRAEVLPNFLPTRMWPKGHKPVTGRILWAGAPSHAEDLEMIINPLQAVMARRPNAHFVCLGWEPTPAFVEACQKRISAYQLVPFEEFPELLSKVGASVAIAPLVDNEFNRCRSAIKVLEYGACGYPVIASPVGEYTTINAELKAPVALVLADTAESWESLLDLSLTHPRDAGPLRSYAIQRRGEDAGQAAVRALLKTIEGM